MNSKSSPQKLNSTVRMSCNKLSAARSAEYLQQCDNDLAETAHVSALLKVRFGDFNVSGFTNR